MHNSTDPFSITVPESIFASALEIFEDTGADFYESIEGNPRFAYANLKASLREAFLMGRTAIHESSSGLSINKEMDGKQAFEGVGRTVLDVLPPLDDGEEKELSIKITKEPGLLDILLKRQKEPKVKREINFTVPPILEEN